MFKQLSTFVSHIVKDAERVMPGIVAAYGELTTAIWTEGGEWTNMRSKNTTIRLGQDTSRLSEAEYINPGTVASLAKRVIDDMTMSETSVIAYTLDCGTGKSTYLPASLVLNKAARRIISVQPSHTVARSLTEYMNNKFPQLQVTMITDENLCMGLNYIPAGVFLRMLAADKIDCEDFILFDEAHSPNFVYGIITDMLNRTNHKVVMLTASTLPYVKDSDVVKCIKVADKTPEVTAQLDSHNTMQVGVDVNGSYLTPAAPLVGATLDLRVVYDTGLRPAPSVYQGKLECGERAARIIELVQMSGRLGRLGKSGKFYYVENPPVHKTRGLSLYDMLDVAYRAIVNLPSQLTILQAEQVLATHGIATFDEMAFVTGEDELISELIQKESLYQRIVPIEDEKFDPVDQITYTKPLYSSDTKLHVGNNVLDTLFAEMNVVEEKRSVVMEFTKAYALIDCPGEYMMDSSGECVHYNTLVEWLIADKLQMIVKALSYPARACACNEALRHFNDDAVKITALAKCIGKINEVKGSGVRRRLMDALKSEARNLSADIQSAMHITQVLVGDVFDIVECELEEERVKAAVAAFMHVVKGQGEIVVPYGSRTAPAFTNMIYGTHYTTELGGKPSLKWDEEYYTYKRRVITGSETSSSKSSGGKSSLRTISLRRNSHGKIECVRSK